MNIEQQLVKNIRMQQLFKKQDKLLIAVSAGVDSQVLLYLLAHHFTENEIIVAHIDHGLRPTSTKEAEFVKRVAQKYNFKCEVEAWKTQPKTGVEAAARVFRYTFLRKVAEKYQATKILTAHHANDQAETFLMKLIRGGDLAQLTAIAWQRVFTEDTDLIRPLLNIPKQDLIDFANVHAIDWYEDESNQDLMYTRNRIRHQLLPQLIAENPQTIKHITEFVDQLTLQDELVTSYTKKKLATIIITNDWSDVDQNWFEIILKAWLKDNNAQLSIKRTQLTQIKNLYFNVQKPQGYIQLTAEIRIEKQYEKLFYKHLRPTQINDKQKDDFMLTLNEWYLLPDGGKFIVKSKSLLINEISLDAERMPVYLQESDLPLMIRPRQVGDRIALKHGHQKVKKILIDDKVPIVARGQVMLITTQLNQILWILNHKQAWLDTTVTNYELIYIPANNK
ncbi:tRNA lysidine(34) synthetase TilS [Periweissella beninensis]|uniref:tRNA lysidine(34) synthetase TilS n=1 Tax=Periweissella beninensis TaxID=504936 RepID=UPI0021A2F841|nr:tRNA lysidine(34) synthetase TilS [Periweissella beninensis]MCT4396380.1 tRNA lysidine(34) synthetase TilS [Periweissella beninensis]